LIGISNTNALNHTKSLNRLEHFWILRLSRFWIITFKISSEVPSQANYQFLEELVIKIGAIQLGT